MKRALLTIVYIFITITVFAKTGYKCILKGDVINRDSKTLYLVKATASMLANKQTITIHHHKFEFVFDVVNTEAYELIFEDEVKKGSWHSIVFFPVAGEVKFKLYDFEKAENDEVIGGKLNELYAAYLSNQYSIFSKRQANINNKINDLEKVNKYRSPARDSLIKLTSGDHSEVDPMIWKKLSAMESNGEAYTKEGNIIIRERDSLRAAIIKWRYDYINSHVNLLSYYLMIQDINIAKDNLFVLVSIQNVYSKFAATYPNHSYTSIITNVLAGLKIKPGDKLIDVSLPDLAGKQYSLTELAKGKIMLIDFWGSWCGPCISNSRTMMPIYQEFKNKGFEIVGIAKEYKDTKALKLRLAKEQYAWINLIEMDDKNGIWNKFGITNSTGMMLLVNKDGIIISVDPTAADVRRELIARL